MKYEADRIDMAVSQAETGVIKINKGGGDGMKFILYFLLYIFTEFNSPYLYAEDKNGAHLALSKPSCEEWLEGRRTDTTVRAFANYFWVNGYLTALNLHLPNTYNITGHVQNDSISLWLDNYCKTYSSNDLGDAMKILVPQLYPNRLESSDEEVGA